MPQNISFSQVNQKVNDAFSIDNGVIKLDVSKITNEEYSSLSDEGIVEFIFKLMVLLNSVQNDININATTPLRSFNTPLYSTVRQTTNPPTIQGTINFNCLLPLNVEEITGNN